VVQFGTPEELYTRPASLFVNNFFGEVCSIPGTVEPRGNGRAVTSVLGAMDVEGLGHVTFDDEYVGACILAVRPEAVTIEPAATVRPGSADGVIRSLRFMGERYRVEVSIGGTALYAYSATPPAEVGDHVGVGIEWQACASHASPGGVTVASDEVASEAVASETVAG